MTESARTRIDHDHDRDDTPECPLGHECAANDESPPTGAEMRNRVRCECGQIVCVACGRAEWWQGL